MNKFSKILINSFIILGVLSAPSFASTTVITAPNEFFISTSSQWNRIETIINDGLHKRVIINWQGRGGRTDMGAEFLNAVTEGQKHGTEVVIRVTGYSASMHALGLCTASKRVYKGDPVLMYHSVGYGNVRYDNSSYKWMFDNCVVAGVIPAYVYDLVQAGNIVYVVPTTKQIFTEKDTRVKI